MLEQLKQLKNPQRALWDQSYHKSQREHWGVSAPQSVQFVRAISKDLPQKELMALANDMWNTDLFDPMMCAARILALPRVKPSDALWQMLLQFLTKVDGWALEDSLCHVAWKCILANESLLDQLDAWTQHPNFWMRRAALVYTLPYAKPGRNPERMLSWAAKYATDPEWFIQKAIGWWLRVLGEHNPQRVRTFLDLHWDHLKSVARKEATRKLNNVS